MNHLLPRVSLGFGCSAARLNSHLLVGWKEALSAAEAATIHAFHDPTEGGLANGLYEIARAGLVGLEVDGKQVYTYPEAEKICHFYNIAI